MPGNRPVQLAWSAAAAQKFAAAVRGKAGSAGPVYGACVHSETAEAVDNPGMTSIATRFSSLVVLCAAAATLVACDNAPSLDWHAATLADAGLQARFPCAPDVAQQKVDFGMEQGAVTVTMMGCDAVDSTYAVSHWLLNDVREADDALAFWEAAVLAKMDAVDSPDAKSGAPFVPVGAMRLSRSIRATVQGVGPSGWTLTTHGVWFARQEGKKARIYHAVIYAPKPQHQVADAFFQGLVLDTP